MMSAAPHPRPLALVVDDEECVRIATALILRQMAGFDALELDRGKTALSLARRYTVDLVISDIRRPGEDGIEFIPVFHAVQPGVPFIIYSGFMTDENKARALARGAFACLQKPCYPVALVSAAHAALENQKP